MTATVTVDGHTLDVPNPAKVREIADAVAVLNQRRQDRQIRLPRPKDSDRNVSYVFWASQVDRLHADGIDLADLDGPFEAVAA